MSVETDQNAMDPAIHDFIEQAIETGVVWGLQHPDGWALSPSSDDDDVLVLPLWSREADAAACATDDWSAYAATPIDLDDLLEAWLPGLMEDGYRAGVNWDAQLEGLEVPPLELQADLENAIEGLDPDAGDEDEDEEDQ